MKERLALINMGNQGKKNESIAVCMRIETRHVQKTAHRKAKKVTYSQGPSKIPRGILKKGA